jgi:TATA-box binding protein (TBP) (component of TFIID and TFIIIB)
MASPTYSTAHPWDPSGCAASPHSSKDGGEAAAQLHAQLSIVGAARAGSGQVHGGASSIRGCGSDDVAVSVLSCDVSRATTRCGTPATRCATPLPSVVELGGTGCPPAREVRRPTIDVKSRFCTSTASFRLNQTPVDLGLLATHIPGGNCIYNISTSGKAKADKMDMAKLLMPVKRRSGPGAGKRHVHLQIFKNGYVCIMGAKSYDEVLRIAARTIDKIKRSKGEDRSGDARFAVPSPNELQVGECEGADANGIRWTCLRFDFDLGFSLKLDTVASVLGKHFHVTYEPELSYFKGITIKAAPTASVVIYASGKGFVTVSKDLGNETRCMDAGQDEGISECHDTSTGASSVTKGMLDLELTEAYDKVCEVLWRNLKLVANLARRVAPRKKPAQH